MASSMKGVPHVIGIEYVEEAIADAKVNSEINGIANTEFHAGDMKDILTDEFWRSSLCLCRQGRPRRNTSRP